jgi:phenylacetic acid degradation operon negative regulatory protein
VATEAHDVLTRSGLDPYVDLFEASYWSFADLAVRIPKWWDLERLQQLYADFLAAHGPVLARYRRRRRIDDAGAFADYVAALTDWRRLPYSDPGLPLELLPARWKGVAAADTFFELRSRLAEPAHAFVDRLRRSAA